MASWYSEGTVTVTNGNAVVTGNGTKFSNCRSGDMFVGPDNGIYQVVNPSSDTSMSISPAYRGSTLAGAAYGIVPVNGYPKALADAVNLLVQQWGATLSALGTTGNYDILPVQKGGTGRTGPAFGTAADATLTTSADDAVIGRVLRVGDRGIGVPLSARVASDPTPRVYLGGWDFCVLTGNTPPGSQDGAMLTMSFGNPVYASQLFADWRQNVLKMRSVVNSGAFGAWQTIYSTQNTTRAADGTLKAI
ncbi:hypothetical protein HX810_20390 [Pseudomonas salomonii]|uniref:Uncharacterized protein n=1 Tax=Pseudomonas salomonii TaxID=191391 RepID=A0A7Y8GFR2_9PSED|nr:hypothetical protein [Pseudomonas salomonii]NWF10034.1 hypothetical protein [Pseudomonas salomonii]